MVPLLVAVLTALAAQPAAAVEDRSTRRPTYGEWTEARANETAAAEAAAAKQSKMGVVDKVVTLLADLRDKVTKEGEVEAATYNKFACFCKDTTKEKSDAITEATDEKATLAADIEAAQSARGDLDAAVSGLLGEVAEAQKALDEAAAARGKEMKTYEVNVADLTGALQSIDGALRSLKVARTAKPPALAQLRPAVDTLRNVALMADALGLGGSGKGGALAFLLQEQAVPTEDYLFHSESIIETVEKLRKDFTDKKSELVEAEVSAAKDHTIFKQEKLALIEEKEAGLERAKKRKAHLQEQIAKDSRQLTTVAATLVDDQEYLKKLAQMCQDKAKTWDQRNTVRVNELTTITQVIGVLQRTVAEKTTAATIRFAQTGVSLKAAQVLAGNDAAMEAAEAAAEDAEAGEAAPSLLQLSPAPKGQATPAPRKKAMLAAKASKTVKAVEAVKTVETVEAGKASKAGKAGKAGKDGGQRALRGEPADGRKAVADLLRRKGNDLHSTLLAALAGKISADPFAKVKQLIQELLDRLMQQSSAEATQKSWCDKSIKSAEMKRKHAAEEVSAANSEMADLEALRDRLGQELEVLATEIAELETAREKAEKVRAEEKAENAETVKEAKEGLEGVQEAAQIIERFYKTVAKEEVDLSLAQRGPVEDAPEAGFETGDAYKGSQSEVGGILGMMDVMKSDFSRTISVTEKAEAEQEEAHVAFLLETGKSLATKNTASTEKTRQKDDAEGELSSREEDLHAQVDLLKNSLKELMELKPACVDTGMTYEERVARREDEMAALKNALCILEAYELYGPDSQTTIAC